jgi:hypothetical protein
MRYQVYIAKELYERLEAIQARYNPRVSKAALVQSALKIGLEKLEDGLVNHVDGSLNDPHIVEKVVES